MNFADLHFIYLFWILPAMVLLAVYAFRGKERQARLFAEAELWRRLTPEGHRRRQVLKFVLLLAGVALLLVALLRPRWGYHWEEIKRKGVDILVAVDVSESMLAEDIKPNRLERAKREIVDLVNMLHGDRIGLIAFAGTSFLECPLTLDYAAFRIFLDYLDTDLIPVPGTAVAEAIRSAIRAFPEDRRASKALILITDGEDHAGAPEKAAEEAKERGIRIFTIGIGSEKGAPIPLRGGQGDFKKDRRGQVVMTRLHETTLQKIALTTGGSYVRSVSGDMDLKKIYEEEIRGRMKAGELESTKKRRWEERFQWFLFSAILLFTLEGFLPDAKPASPREGTARARFRFLRRTTGLWIALVPFLLSWSVPPAAAESVFARIREAEHAYGEKAYDKALQGFLDAQVERPDDLRLKYDVGNAQYRMRNFGEAERAFRAVAAAADPDLRERAIYNLGNCAYKQGRLEEAVALYQKALEMNPKDEEARFNLEFVREEMKRRLKEAEERKKRQQEARREGKKQEGEGKEARADTSTGSGGKGTGGEKRAEASTSPRADEEQARQGEAQRAEQEASGREGQAVSQAQEAREMSPEEAARWLNSLDEDQKGLAKKQIRKMLGTPSRLPSEDW